MIDEERFADGGAGVNVDAGVTVRPFRHHARNVRDFQMIEPMRQALHGDGLDARIAEQHLLEAGGGGVVAERGVDVGGHQAGEFRQALERQIHAFPCRFLDSRRRPPALTVALEIDGAADLASQEPLDVFEIHTRLTGKVAPAIAVVEKREQSVGVAVADLRDGCPAGEFEALIPAPEVGLERLAKRQRQRVHLLQIHTYTFNESWGAGFSPRGA